MEIANGYDELVDASEQSLRFAADQIVRKQRGLPVYATDERLLQALEHGVGQCAGVALGVDRLLMLATASRSIDEVLAFGYTRA
jgi:lysyl-tRNA synthetase class 2